MGKPKSISQPIKRLPGQSLRKKRDELFDSMVNDPMAMVWAGFMCLILECMHVLGKIPPSIWLGVAIVVPTMAYGICKVLKSRKILRTYRRGEEGERKVAQAIEQDLIPQGYTVFHDIPLENNGKYFNIDHLLIGENGIFAIETKNYDKPPTGSPEVRYDGHTILWAGKKHTNRDEIAQARAAAISAKKFIDELTGLNVYVHPVLCAVGWYVNSTNVYGNPVLLTMEKTLKSTIPKFHAKTVLSEADRNKIICALARSSQD